LINKKKPFGFVLSSGKFIRRDVLEKYKIADGESKQLKDTFSQIYTSNGLIEPPYNPEGLAALAEINTFHARCCETKASDVALRGWEIISKADSPSEKELEILEGFLDNHQPSFPYVLKKACQDFEEIGWGALEVIREGNLPDSRIQRLEHIPSHTLRLHESLNKYAQTWDGVNLRWFKVFGYDKDVHMDTGEEYPLGSLEPEERANELIVVHNYSSRSSFYGVPDFIPAISAIAGDEAQSEYNRKFFENYGVPSYAVFITGDYEDEEILDAQGNPTGKTILQETIEEYFSYLAENPHAPLVIAIPGAMGDSVKIKFEKLSTELKEASFRMYRQDNRNEIVTAHGVDPYRLGVMVLGSLGGNTAKLSRMNYLEGVVATRQQLWAQVLNKRIISEGFGIKDWELSPKLSEFEVMEDEIETYISLFKIGVLSPNEVRTLLKNKFGLKRVEHPAMDDYYVVGAMKITNLSEAEPMIKPAQDVPEDKTESPIKPPEETRDGEEEG